MENKKVNSEYDFSNGIRGKYINNMKTYKLNLDWQPKLLEYYGEIQQLKIWDGQYIRIMDNGEGYFNIHRYDSNGNEIYDGLGGFKNILAAQKLVEGWLDKQLLGFMVEV